LLDSVEPEPDDTPENIAKAWELEIARRIDEIDAGLVKSIPYEQIMAEARSLIESGRKR
jgi:putative addiction module component (TIGR02574 family)